MRTYTPPTRQAYNPPQNPFSFNGFKANDPDMQKHADILYAMFNQELERIKREYSQHQQQARTATEAMHAQERAQQSANDWFNMHRRAHYGI